MVTPNGADCQRGVEKRSIRRGLNPRWILVPDPASSVILWPPRVSRWARVAGRRVGGVRIVKRRRLERPVGSNRWHARSLRPRSERTKDGSKHRFSTADLRAHSGSLPKWFPQATIDSTNPLQYYSVNVISTSFAPEAKGDRGDANLHRKAVRLCAKCHLDVRMRSKGTEHRKPPPPVLGPQMLRGLPDWLEGKMNIQPLQEAIQQGMKAEADRIISEIIERSKGELEKRLRDYAAKVAVNVCQKVAFEPYGPNAIRIIVEFPTTGK